MPTLTVVQRARVDLKDAERRIEQFRRWREKHRRAPFVPVSKALYHDLLYFKKVTLALHIKLLGMKE
jgi:hypothetical protein